MPDPKKQLSERPFPHRQNPHVRPLMIVVSAPSGAGKSTLCNRLVSEHPGIVYSVSCTTRPPREGEQDGVDYYFLSKQEFKKRIKNNEFLEYAKVHGNYYGTLQDIVLFAMEEGRHVLLDIDVQGAAQIRKSLRKLPATHPVRLGFIDIFIVPPSMQELERRLRNRGTDSEEVIARRLKSAKAELAHQGEYEYLIVNDDLEEAYGRLKEIVESEESDFTGLITGYP